MISLCFQPFPELVTERLRLRNLKETDASFIFSLRTDHENGKYLDLPVPKDQKECLSYIARMQKGIADNKYIYWAIERIEDQTMIGTICLWNFNIQEGRAELGYELQLSAQKQGYMNEALSAVIDFATDNLGLTKLEAYTHEKNDPSSRLLEKHEFGIVGYKKETHSRTGQSYKYAIYSRSFH